MTVLRERRLQISVSGEVNARKFDDESTHRLSHCMMAVDFIVEFDDRYVFIEMKDPQHPDARLNNQQTFIQNFQSGVMDKELATKYRDSLLYEWASGRAKKPIDYFVLCAWEQLDSAQLGQRTDGLRRELPILGPDGKPWLIARDCGVFNVESWNRRFPQWPISALY